MVDLPPGMRAFDDVDGTRQRIYDSALGSLQKRFPISDGVHRLELSDVRYSGPQHFDLKRQKSALISNRSIKTPITGKWRLIDEGTGKVLDEREDIVMHIPYYTQRGTFINRGNEYTVVNQARLKPGVYTRTKKSGEHEAQFNIKRGTGKSFRMWMEPSTGIFRVNVGQANIPAYPFLRNLGLTDIELRKAWGDGIYQANVNKTDNNAISKLYQRFSGYNYDPDADDGAQKKFLSEELQKFEMDPEVVERTLGIRDTSTLTPAALLRASQKLININRGEEDPDNRESPEFSNIYGIEDYVKERIDLDAGRTARQLLYDVRRKKNLQRVRRGALNNYITSLMLGSGLAAPLEETNPFQLLDQHHRVTKMGEGGIGSAQAITDEARDVNPGQIGFTDPVSGPENEKIGVDARIAYRTFKGDDQQLYAEFKNSRTGKTEVIRHKSLVGKVLAFPGEMTRAKKQGFVYAVKDGEMGRFKPKEVDYEVPSFSHMFGPTANMQTMPTGYMASRGFYSAKYWSQLMPMEQGEAPLVTSAVPDSDQSFHNYYGRKIGTLNAPASGIVTKVTDSSITITDEDGKKKVVEMAKDFPFNRLTQLTHYPTVQPGQVVNAGDMLARSNFTDEEGTINMGVNLKTAVVPAEAWSFEDAYVVSESAAKKMATERLHGFDKDANRGTTLGKSRFVSLFPKEFTKDQLENIGPDGAVRQGTTVKKGDPLILAVGPKLLSAEDAELGKLHKALRNSHRNEATVWEYDHPGVVTDVGSTTTGMKVNVKSVAPARVADKLTNSFASKGIIGKIVPDDEMPRDPDTDEPYEMLLNPMVILSRVAPNQLAEMQLSKIAKKTGNPYVLPQEAPEEGWADFTNNELKKHGLSARKKVYDPKLGRELPALGEGYSYISAFHHLAEKKLSGRSTGGYTADREPARAGKTGAKRMSLMDTNAMLAHGATEVLRDSQLIRGVQNQDFWTRLKLGQPLPEPGVPFIYEKFVNTMKAGGINLQKNGDLLSIMPMTNADIDNLSGNRFLKGSGTVNAKNFEPVSGGLFDQRVTGGIQGRRWSAIKLSEPMPNPVMEEPIRRILGLKVKDMAEVIAGRQEIDGLSGTEGLRQALSKIDIDREIDRHRSNISRYKGANRDNSVKALRYLMGAKKQGIQPSDWIIDKVPVLPPVFRPISQVGDMLKPADLNGLYRDVIEVNDSIGKLRGQVGEDSLSDEKLELYRSVQAAFGLGQPTSQEGSSKRWKGAVRQVIGTSPKHGMLQAKLLSKNVDMVGRGVIAPDPTYDMDTIGIPAKKAWTIYEPFIIRRLVKRGYPAIRAKELVQEKDKVAKEMMLEEMRARPVIADRAPTWHKFNLLAFEPVLVDEDVIRVSPLIVGGFNADFDGDTMSFHVPVSDKAVTQAREKMMPSKNLFSLTDLKSVQHKPSKEMSMGLYQLTRKPTEKPPQTFATVKDMKKALREGLIGINDPVVIQNA